jgi:nitroreductase
MHHMPTKIIKQRRSVRRYKADPVPEEVIRDVLDCARLAPTARNKQPWLIGAVTDPELRGEIAHLADHGRFIDQAPVCFAVFSLKKEKYYLEDAVAATMNILTAASAHGLSACWVAGDKKRYGKKVAALLGIPRGYGLVTLVACGYSDDTPSPAKKRLEEMSFVNKYGA